MSGRQNHSRQSHDFDTEPLGFVSLKDPPSMHLRDDMVKRTVKTTDGRKTWECAMTWAEFEKRYAKAR